MVKPETYDIQPRGHCLRHSTECQNLERMSYPIDPEANAACRRLRLLVSSGRPFPFRSIPADILNTYLWRPVDVDHVTVWRGWYTPDGVDSEIIRRLAVQDRATTVEEDIHLVESVQRGLRSKGYKPGPLVLDPKCGVNSEHSLLALHRWMREGAGG